MSLKTTLSNFMDNIWNAGDYSKVEHYVAPEYTIKHDPGDAWDGQTLDHATFIERVGYSRNAFPDLNFAIQEMIEEGDKVVASWVMSGTHKGDLDNIPATGKPFSITGMTIYYFQDGKICGHWQAYDRLGFIGQMGIMG